MEEFNVDSKAECDQLNLAHAGRHKIILWALHITAFRVQ